MLKFLFIAAIFAVPIFSIRRKDHIYVKKSIIEVVYCRYATNCTEKCLQVSSTLGVDDFKHFEKLYQAYDDCAAGVGDYEQFFLSIHEVFTNVAMVHLNSKLLLSEKQKSNIVAFFQTYCPKLIQYMKCDDVVSPIYDACYTTAQRNEFTLGKASWLQVLDNFCENNVEKLVNVVNNKGFECGLSKSYSCFLRLPDDPFSNPQLYDFCRFYNMTLNCMGPIFKECDLSQTPDTLMKSFFNNIQSETICENFLNNNNRPKIV